VPESWWVEKGNEKQPELCNIADIPGIIFWGRLKGAGLGIRFLKALGT